MSRAAPATRRDDDGLTVRSLDPTTWDAFAAFFENKRFMFAGCWCASHHSESADEDVDRRTAMHRRVCTGQTHAALVFQADPDDGDNARLVGWAQYGSVNELPRFAHRREYDKAPPATPDWRISCIVVDKSRRGHGIAHAALRGAMDQIARSGGGLVEAITDQTSGRIAQSRFLYCGTLEMFQANGFQRIRQVGKYAWIVSRQIEPQTD